MTPSTAELGSIDKFRGLHVVPDDGTNAVCACGVLLACRDDEAARFEQVRERRHSREQIVVVHRGLRPSLRGALVLLATVAMAMMAAAATATRGCTTKVERCDGDV